MKKLVTALILLIISYNLNAESAAEQFGAQKRPVEYKLEVDNEPGLCKKLAVSTKKLFDSAAVSFDVEKAFFEETAPIQWSPLNQKTTEYSTPSIFTLKLDLDANGTNQVLVYRDMQFNWKGNWHYAYIFRNEQQFESHKSEILSSWSDLKENKDQYSTENNFGGIGYFPSYKSDREDLVTGNVWAEHKIFKFNNHFYFFSAANDFDILHPIKTSIYRLYADGHIKKSCEIYPNGATQQYEKFANYPQIKSYLKIIRTIGAGGPDLGTAHYGLMHDTQATAAEHRAAYRPWALDQANSPYYIFDERLLSYLENWSLESAWNRREYQTLLEHMIAAEIGEANFLKNEFGLTDDAAKKVSKNIIQQLLASRILVPSGYQLNAHSTELYFPLNKLSGIALTRNTSGFDTIPNQQKHKLIHFSIEWPYSLTKLLSAGVETEMYDEIQKTPLMLAAHLNRIDSVKTLIAAGANVNAKTSFTPIFSQEAIINGRTALMYAAENANPAVIKTLLEAGANIDAKDSANKTAANYQEKNPRLSDEDKKLGLLEIAKQSARFSKPSFDCKKATSAIEKAICSDEVLAIFDNELNYAFGRAKIRFGDQMVKEQQAWLIRRKNKCADIAVLQDCLAEVTRTRIRYLHNRFAE